MKKKDCKECTNCIMDSGDDPEITFNKNGICNHCTEFKKEWEKYPIGTAKRLAELENKIEEIKRNGKGKKYDCLIGLSGGVDSTYVALLVKKYGLRPLVVHLDNGWNSEIAVQNIHNIISKLGFDLYTIVINWEEFKDLQLSFLKASVVDLELTSDHAIFSTMFNLAHKYKVDYIISGFNLATEGILPAAWRWDKMDWLNIKDIHKKFGKKKLKTFPHLDFYKKFYYEFFKKIKTIQILNYIDYDKDKVKIEIAEKLNWKDYGGKHFESIITRFYQGYILPEKFGIDKRKAHLASMIAMGTISKEQALNELKKPIYEESQYKSDREFVLKKFGLSDAEFDKIMKLPIKLHTDYKNYRNREYHYHEQFFNKLNKTIGRKK